ncbi:endonuclease/exonuclease/phosphatase family protein [Parafrankia sp. BMG5.11]|uniref:endonuclease/exonuclease/phosphatase family protein n=1 Tax=Parafrankia sp. BMG5.11 TaxID=222540 RepID=UPI001FB454B3|nr:endonuclease/exonuclease/phosphatase family protein [Parafrankia sp. BMG5.11]
MRGRATGSQTLTELGGTINTIKLTSSNALPSPAPVSFADAFAKTGNLEAQPLEPGAYVLDWLEVHEGMRVTVAQDTRLISPVDTEFGELWVTLKPAQNPTPRGGSAYVSYDDPNSGRLMLQALNGAPGGNIRQVFLFNPARTAFVDRPGGDANTAVTVLKARPTSNQIMLSASPGRINPTSSVWNASRKPLVGEFLYDGNKQLFVIANHFNSKGGDYPLTAAVQPPNRTSEVQRIGQATEVRDFVADLAAKSGNTARVVVLGDINDYQFSPTLATLTDNGALLKTLISELPVNERYSYVFDGNSQTLDHILISPTIKGYSYGVVHINAEFSDQASDHDPQILRILTGCGSEPLPERCRPGSPVVDVR